MTGQKKKALLLAIEGVDGCGKTTLVKELVKLLKELGITAQDFCFPDYSLPSGKRIKKYLGNELTYMDCRNIAALFSFNRFEMRPAIDTAMSCYDVVIFDRYIESNLALQGCRYKQELSITLTMGRDRKVRQFHDDILNLEFTGLGNLQADVSYFIDLPVCMCIENAGDRGVQDKHESNSELMFLVHEYYTQRCAENHMHRIVAQDVVSRKQLTPRQVAAQVAANLQLRIKESECQRKKLVNSSQT